MQKIKKIHRVNLEKNASQIYGQTKRTDFIGPLRQKWRFDHVFWKPKIKFSEIIWLDCEPYEKNQYKKKEHNQHSSMFREFKNNDP